MITSFLGRGALALALSGLTVLVLPGSASAAANVMPEVSGAALTQLQAQRDALFKQMLADPGNVDLTLQYAKLSSQAGDLEGAISALERLAIFAPEVGRIKFELGVLYLRLAAYDLAKADFEAAGAAADATPELKATIATYLAGIDHQSAGDRLSGGIMLGARYQTNANGGTDSRYIDLGGTQFLLSDSAMAAPDASGFVSADLHYSHDLASQGDRIDADLGAYGALYGEQHQIDTGVLEARLGPVFNLERYSIAHSTLGIYGIAGTMALEAQPYRYSLGMGAVVTTDFDPQSKAHLRLEYRYEDFVNSADRPTVSDMTGNRTRLTGDVQHMVTDWLSLSALLYGERKDAVEGFDADWEAGATADATIRFRGPIGSQPRPWLIDLSVGVITRQFDVPDSSISIDSRHDDEANIQGTLTVPIGDSWSALATVGYRKVWSNYTLYALDDLSTSLAMLKQF